MATDQEHTEVSLEDILTQGRQLLDVAESQQCIDLLAPIALDQPDQPELLPLYQMLGEAFLEVGNPKDAYELLMVCANFDPQGEEGGFEKFLWLGQLTGGREGESWYEKGINGLKSNISKLTEAIKTPKTAEELKLQKQKLCEALCGIVEIWMTDLCMEPEAEAKCDALITEALMFDDKHAESWSVLGSIRISQQRDEDAKIALQKSWDLYHETITDAIRAANIVSGTNPLTDLASAIPALIRLAQNMLEMKLYKQTIEVTADITRIDDEVPEPYYLHGLARFELYKQYLENEPDAPRKAARQAAGAREAWETLLKLASMDADIDPDLAPTVTENLKQLPVVQSDDYTSSEEEIDDSDLELDDFEDN